ncbi:MAG: NADP-dependent phosphogluconate dehydrogenase [Syntrophaceae bacterium]|nr:NADP-dependent phosphogluconate dehydrogenase [Syntrophaceae bacterium]
MTHECDIGLIGLGVMGRNLALNMADHGFSVGVYNRTAEKTREFIEKEAGERKIRSAYTLQEFISLLKKPRAILIMVEAGAPVDDVIEGIFPLLEVGDLVIDGGNSHFSDTNRRGKSLAEKGLFYMGMGISGGEYGARHGPSMMPGGQKEAFERVRPILEAVSANVNGEPCVAFLGSGSAGHYVKMVHNGIEYGVMELIAETYDLMKRRLCLTNDELHSVYGQWNRKELNSYLIEITTKIFQQPDDKTAKRLIDMIVDQAKQKGTGKWTSCEAMDLQIPTPTIDAAVIARNLSTHKTEREAVSQMLQGPKTTFRGDKKTFIDHIRGALYACMIITYAQGMNLLQGASEAYGYGLNLEAVARIWRGGCIIRAALLENIQRAYENRRDLVNLLLDPHLGQEVMERQANLRRVVITAIELGLPVPAMMVTLAYFDGYRSAWLPANLTQAQRDYFGAHTYERIDKGEGFHTEWGRV